MTDEAKPEAGSANYSRRDALRALARYSVAVGGASTVIVSAEGLVSAASAYNCPPNSNAPFCNGNGGTFPGGGGGGGGGNGRGRF